MHNFGKVRTIQTMGTVQPNGAARSRIETIADEIIARIERGVLRPGERLPSIRGASELFGASKNTIVDAYERLVASGQIESKPGSGFTFPPIAPSARKPSNPPRLARWTVSGCCASNLKSVTRCASAMAARPPRGWKVRKSALIRVPSAAPVSAPCRKVTAVLTGFCHCASASRVCWQNARSARSRRRFC